MGHKSYCLWMWCCNVKFLCQSPGDDTAVYLNNFSGKYSQPGAAKNSFSIYRVNAVSMTAPEAQFKRL
ncbi:hypothetical protein FTV90_10415 [Escherichia coli]|nr:hypothetical protein FTV90_10415 [Escherichia coli]